LARQLLEDFVLGHCMRKEYRLQYHLKMPLPDEELRAFYEKIQEQAAEPPAGCRRGHEGRGHSLCQG